MEFLLEDTSKEALEGLYGEARKTFASPASSEVLFISAARVERIKAPSTPRLYKPLDSTGWTFRAAAGRPFLAPIAGTFIAEQSGQAFIIPYNATAGQVQSAFNGAFGAGFVTVEALTPAYFIIRANAVGARDPITVDPSGLEPLSIAEAGRLIIGDANRRDVQTIRLIQNPGAYAILGAQSPAAGAEVQLISNGGPSVNHKVRILFTRGIYDGRWSVRIGESESLLLPFDISEDELRKAIEQMASVGAGNVQAFKDGEGDYLIGFQGEKAGQNMGEIFVDGSGLKAVQFFSGNLDLRTEGIELFLAGQDSREALFVIEGTPPGGSPRELCRTDIRIVAGLIDPAFTSPQPRIEFYSKPEIDTLVSGLQKQLVEGSIYVASAFNPGTGIVVGFGFDPRNFRFIHEGRAVFNFNDGRQARDPSITYVNGRFFIACTVATHGAFYTSGYFAILASDDLVNWTLVTEISAMGIPDVNPNVIWAPEFLVDGSEVSVYVTVTVGVKAKFFRWTAISQDLSEWSEPVEVTGVDLPGMIDAFVLKEGGVYNLFGKVQDGSPDTNKIFRFTSNSPTENFVRVGGQIGPLCEAPCIIALPQGGYRMFHDTTALGEQRSGYVDGATDFASIGTGSQPTLGPELVINHLTAFLLESIPSELDSLIVTELLSRGDFRSGAYRPAYEPEDPKAIGTRNQYPGNFTTILAKGDFRQSAGEVELKVTAGSILECNRADGLYVMYDNAAKDITFQAGKFVLKGTPGSHGAFFTGFLNVTGALVCGQITSTGSPTFYGEPKFTVGTNTLTVLGGSIIECNRPDGLYFMFDNYTKPIIFQRGNVVFKGDGTVNFGNLKTSAAGLVAGDLWRDGDVIRIV